MTTRSQTTSNSTTIAKHQNVNISNKLRKYLLSTNTPTSPPHLLQPSSQQNPQKNFSDARNNNMTSAGKTHQLSPLLLDTTYNFLLSTNNKIFLPRLDFSEILSLVRSKVPKTSSSSSVQSSAVFNFYSALCTHPSPQPALPSLSCCAPNSSFLFVRSHHTVLGFHLFFR